MQSRRRTFLKQLGCGAAGLALVSFTPGCLSPQQTVGRSRLPRSTPEAEGVSSTAILGFLDAVEKQKHELHSFIMLRHGCVIAEGWWSPYAPYLNHTMYSMSKSFTSTAVGFAVAEGRLKVTDRVVSFFPNDLPEVVSENLAAVRVKDLLTMSVGHAKDPTFDVVRHDDWVKAFLATPVCDLPGTHFVYNSVATYMLSAIVQKVTGQRIIDFLTPRLFAPLGIEGMTWETCPKGINVGGWGLSIQTEGLAKFGELYRQKGLWEGHQILPASWVEEATSFQVQQPAPAHPSRPNAQNDWLRGYGYQFWRSQNNAFRGDGAFGQYTIVMPDQEIVIAMTGETRDMQGELDLVWEHLLPAAKSQPISPNKPALEQLQRKLSGLRLAPEKGESTSKLADEISGKCFKIQTNGLGLQTAAFVFRNNTCLITLKDAQREHSIHCGIQRWELGETALPGTPPRLISGGAPKPGTPSKVAASGAWKDDNTFEMMFRYYETPHHDSVTCRFEGKKVKIAFMNSMAKMGPSPRDSRPVLEGEIEPA